MEKLDEERVLLLLAKADTEWFKGHSGVFAYRDHLKFSAEFVAKYYYDRRIKKDNF